MVFVLLVCVLMALLSAVFWVVEIRPLWIHVQSLPDIKWKDGALGMFANPVMAANRLIDYVRAMPKGIYFFIDITATVLLAGLFGLGGVIGTTMGLTISNVISVALVIDMKTRSKRELEVIQP